MWHKWHFVEDDKWGHSEIILLIAKCHNFVHLMLKCHDSSKEDNVIYPKNHSLSFLVLLIFASRIASVM